MEENKQQPLVIDMQLIKSLRYQGKYDEATELLKTFRESVDKGKKQIKKEIEVRDRKIIANNCIKLNLCRICKENPPMKNKRICLRCKQEKSAKYKESLEETNTKGN